MRIEVKLIRDDGSVLLEWMEQCHPGVPPHGWASGPDEAIICEQSKAPLIGLRVQPLWSSSYTGQKSPDG